MKALRGEKEWYKYFIGIYQNINNTNQHRDSLGKNPEHAVNRFEKHSHTKKIKIISLNNKNRQSGLGVRKLTHAQSIKNLDFIRASRRLKDFRNKVSDKKAIVGTLFYDPLKPLNLKSHYLVGDEKVECTGGFTEQINRIRRQNHISRNFRRSRLNSNNTVVLPKLYIKEVDTENGKSSFFQIIINGK